MSSLTQQQMSRYHHKNSSGDKPEGLPRANGTPQSKKIILFLDDLLHALKSQKGLKAFAFFVFKDTKNESKVQLMLLKKLSEGFSLMEGLVLVGQEFGYEFTEEDVKKVFGVLWSPRSIEYLLSKLKKWTKKDLLQFLTDVTTEADLQDKLNEIGERNNFVTFLTNTFKQLEKKNKYRLTEQDIEEATKLIPFKVPKIVGRIWC